MYDIITYNIKYINKNKLFLNLFLEQIKSRIIFFANYKLRHSLAFSIFCITKFYRKIYIEIRYINTYM